MNTIRQQVAKIARILVILMAMATVVRADVGPAPSPSPRSSPAPSPRPSPVPFSSAAVTPIVKSTLWKSLGFPALGAVGVGAVGFFASQAILRRVAAEAAKKWIPTILARGTGTILGAVGGALLVNYLFDLGREARVRRVRASQSTPPESHPERVTDSLPPDPGQGPMPGFEDLNFNEEFPR
jgi:hypothetical protein